VSEPARDELVAPGQRLADAGREGFRVLRIDPDGGITCRLVQRGMRGDDAGHSARHRLDDRDAEPLEARRIDERRRAAIELREPLVLDVAEVGRREEPQVRVEQGPRRAQGVQVSSVAVVKT
jgi:hypothetical protein